MKTKRDIILVFGTHGVAIAPALLVDHTFSVRVLTRDFLAARHLNALGADVMIGDAADRPALRSALKGCYGVFASVGKDPDLARSIVNVIAGSDVEHVVFAAADRERVDHYARTVGLVATYTIDPNPPAGLVSLIFSSADVEVAV